VGINTNPLTPSLDNGDAFDQPKEFSPTGNLIIDGAVFVTGLAYPPFGVAYGIYSYGKDAMTGDPLNATLDVFGLLPGVGSVIGAGQIIYNDVPPLIGLSMPTVQVQQGPAINSVLFQRPAQQNPVLV
jgi:hypothetical protein